MVLWKMLRHCCKEKTTRNDLILGIMLIVAALILFGTVFNRDIIFAFSLKVLCLNADEILQDFKWTFVTICTGIGLFSAVSGMALIVSIANKVFKAYQQEYVLQKEIEDIDFSDEFPEAENHRNIKKGGLS